MPKSQDPSEDQTDDHPISRLEVLIEVSSGDGRKHHLHSDRCDFGHPFHCRSIGMGSRPLIAHMQLAERIPPPRRKSFSENRMRHRNEGEAFAKAGNLTVMVRSVNVPEGEFVFFFTKSSASP